MHRIPLLSLLLLIACQPPVQPAAAPMAVASPRAPAAVLRAATRELKSQGFEITASDDVRGLLSAKVTRRPLDFGTQINCARIRGVDIGDHGQTTMTIDLEARARTGGSDVTLVSRTRTRAGDPDTPYAIDDEKTCTSSGIVETSVVKAIGG
jgi:hypothetical protein